MYALLERSNMLQKNIGLTSYSYGFIGILKGKRIHSHLFVKITVFFLSPIQTPIPIIFMCFQYSDLQVYSYHNIVFF